LDADHQPWNAAIQPALIKGQFVYQDTIEDFFGELAEVHFKQLSLHLSCLLSQSFVEGN